MLDKLIHKHLDEMADIEDAVAEDIEKAIRKIDIAELMKDPKSELETIVQIIEEMLMEKYFPRVIKEGVAFSAEVRKSKEIIVSDTNNPKLNEKVVIGDKLPD